MLTRFQFDAACIALIAKYSDIKDESSATDALRGWFWKEHPSMSGYGFMSRTIMHTRRSKSFSMDDHLCVDGFEQAFPDEDAAVLFTPSTSEELISQQYVVFSATFQVPAFYFTLHDTMGSPLDLADILKTSLFQHFAFEGTEATTFGLMRAASSFPLLSQGDHPTLGTPCWYLHPCETRKSVEEVMSEVGRIGWTEELRLVRWLEVWFMVVGTAVNFRP